MARLVCFFFLALVLASGTAVGQDSRDTTDEARKEFQRATQFVSEAQWHEALGLFEHSNRLRPHPVTLFNVAVCERALGHYTRARDIYQQILQPPASGNVVAPAPEALLAEIRGYARELDALFVHVSVSLEPIGSTMAVDGRPLDLRGDSGSEPVLWAGLAEPGGGKAVGVARFELVLDPGAHLLEVARPGYAPVVVRVAYAPGDRKDLPLALERLPATLHVLSDRSGAAVSVDGVDVGLAPLDLSRPAGHYQVRVQKQGFVPHAAAVDLGAGQEVSLHASLDPLRVPIYKKWWFWTAAGVVIAGAALGAYFGARALEEPQLNSGGLQWIANVR